MFHMEPGLVVVGAGKASRMPEVGFLAIAGKWRPGKWG